jgi:hypothetical protein
VSTARHHPARPKLKAGLRRVWRDAGTLQLGLDPAGAVVIGGLDPATAALVEGLDGTRDLAGVFTAAGQLGIDASRAAAVLDLLTRSGVLDDAAADHRALGALEQLDRDRLAPDVAAASVVRPGDDGGVSVLARRRASTVSVHGAGRVGASVVNLLAAAGVGTLLVEDTGTTLLADCAPAGLRPDDAGARRQDAATRFLSGTYPSVRTRSHGRDGRAPDLALVTTLGPVDAALADGLVRNGTPHLFATVREGTGLVGPFVLPGRSSCRRCHDLHRSDRDPAWPSIAAQLAADRGGAAVPCDVVLATAVAAHAALQALAFLDLERAEDIGPAAASLPLALDGTIEISQADGRVRRRSWSPHPLCGCAWPDD